MLPDKIVSALYPTPMPPKRQYHQSQKPKPEGNPVELLEAFVTRNMVTDGASVSITSLTKKNTALYEVYTSYECGTCHTIDTPFVIKKKQAFIQQKCKCKTREHVLADKIVKLL